MNATPNAVKAMNASTANAARFACPIAPTASAEATAAAGRVASAIRGSRATMRRASAWTGG